MHKKRESKKKRIILDIMYELVYNRFERQKTITPITSLPPPRGFFLLKEGEKKTTSEGNILESFESFLLSLI